MPLEQSNVGDDRICAFCVLRHQVRPRLRWSAKERAHVCPVCKAVIRFPSDPDATAQDLGVMFVEGAESTKRRGEQQEEAYYSKPRLHDGGPLEMGGSSSKGRRKRQKRKPSPWYNNPFERPG